MILQVVLEGMGRALHTNFNAQFKCEALKVLTSLDRIFEL